MSLSAEVVITSTSIITTTGQNIQPIMMPLDLRCTPLLNWLRNPENVNNCRNILYHSLTSDKYTITVNAPIGKSDERLEKIGTRSVSDRSREEAVTGHGFLYFQLS